MALIIILSVFNGLEDMVRSIFNTFDPDLKITPALGKTFPAENSKLEMLANINGIACYSLTIEENVLLRYGERETVATIKGVDDSYVKVTGIDSAMWDGEFILKSDKQRDYAIPGIGIANYLGIGITFITPINIYVPKRTGGSTVNAEELSTGDSFTPQGYSRSNNHMIPNIFTSLLTLPGILSEMKMALVLSKLNSLIMLMKNACGKRSQISSVMIS